MRGIEKGADTGSLRCEELRWSMSHSSRHPNRSILFSGKESQKNYAKLVNCNKILIFFFIAVVISF